MQLNNLDTKHSANALVLRYNIRRMHFRIFLKLGQTNENEMPTNDASITWDIKKSKIVKVATLKIPIQIFATKERYKLAENLSLKFEYNALFKENCFKS